MGIERATFLLDATGVIRRVWRKVKVKNHAAEVLATARGLLPT
jgi:peroxiredoxin Q/BCP